VAALIMLNRLDAGLLVLPALAVAAMAGAWRATVRAAAAGLAPLAAWHVFSLVYYGVPFPNTAYAKLQTGIAARGVFRDPRIGTQPDRRPGAGDALRPSGDGHARADLASAGAR
jgi:hypothetical protein